MKKAIAIVALFLTFSVSGCAFKIDHDLDADVDVTHTVDMETLYQFFLKICDYDKQCADDKTNEFLEWLYLQGNQPDNN